MAKFGFRFVRILTAFSLLGLLGLSWIASDGQLALARKKTSQTEPSSQPKESQNLPPALSQDALKKELEESWERYKKQFIQADGRVIDYTAAVSTSEGQSYGMLRSFWMRDKAV